MIIKVFTVEDYYYLWIRLKVSHVALMTFTFICCWEVQMFSQQLVLIISRDSPHTFRYMLYFIVDRSNSFECYLLMLKPLNKLRRMILKEALVQITV